MLEATRDCLNLFCTASVAMASESNIDFRIVGVNDPPSWFPPCEIIFDRGLCVTSKSCLAPVS